MKMRPQDAISRCMRVEPERHPLARTKTGAFAGGRGARRKRLSRLSTASTMDGTLMVDSSNAVHE
jgi:hypothetical protein